MKKGFFKRLIFLDFTLFTYFTLGDIHILFRSGSLCAGEAWEKKIQWGRFPPLQGTRRILARLQITFLHVNDPA